MEEPSSQLAVADKLISGVLLNIGWIVMLIGLEPLGARWINGTRTYSLTAVIVITLIGTIALVAGMLWPPSNPETKALLGTVAQPILSNFTWLLLALITILWLTNLIPMIRAGEIKAVATDVAEIKTTLERFVLPRHLTPTQKSKIIGYLSSHEPQEVSFEIISNDNEAGIYAGDIREALVGGGWKVSGYNYPDKVSEGLGTDFRETSQTASDRDPRHLNAKDLLEQAFNLGDVQIDGSSGAGGGSTTTKDSLTIKVGPRRRDGFGYGSPEMITIEVPKK